jgi:hypothetical protein
MSTERSDDLQSIKPEETIIEEKATGASGLISHNNAWYRYLNEDWLATLFGLLLVILLVVGWLHSIP